MNFWRVIRLLYAVACIGLGIWNFHTVVSADWWVIINFSLFGLIAINAISSLFFAFYNLGAGKYKIMLLYFLFASIPCAYTGFVLTRDPFYGYHILINGVFVGITVLISIGLSALEIRAR